MPDYDDPPPQIEVYFNLGETNVAVVALSQVPILPRAGETIHLGKDREDGGGSYDVVGLRHEYSDRSGTASPTLVRITVLVKRRSGEE